MANETFKASDLIFEEIPASELKTPPPKEELKFGKVFTDYILEVDWNSEEGWGKPIMKQFSKFELHPAAAGLHYGIQCFEGMKAYIGPNKEALVFRPRMNMLRMNRSAGRVTMPSFDPDEGVKCILEFVKREKRWIPEGDGYSLYMRPTMISTTPWLGVGPTQNAKFYLIACPVGPYFASGFAPVTLYADPEHVRAWPGGAGCYKVGGNYAPTITIQMDAAKKGCQQVMWLLPKGDDYFVSEAGTMNLFCFLINEKGEKELVTQPLDDGTILPGVTRHSVLELTKKWGEFKVSERMWGMKELVKASEEGRILEIFGAGTACLIAPVNGVMWKDKMLKIPLDPKDEKAQVGPLAKRLAGAIFDIQYGRVESDWTIKV